jgi:hypothetical protein
MLVWSKLPVNLDMDFQVLSGSEAESNLWRTFKDLSNSKVKVQVLHPQSQSK